MSTAYIRATATITGSGTPTIYTCPTGKTAIVSFSSVTETNNSTATGIGMYMTDHANADAIRYLQKNQGLTAYQSIRSICKGLVLNAGDTLVCAQNGGVANWIVGILENT